ncbi:MAG TPA: ABC transporter permease [Candidatus Binatia bacterium]
MSELERPEDGGGLALFARLARERALIWALIRRDIGARFAGSRLGFFWSLANPAIQLVSYSVIFGLIYGAGAATPRPGDPGLVPALFCGLWPWWAFSDGTMRGYGSLVDQSALLKRFAMPAEACIVAATTAAFLLQMVGFLLFLGAFALLGVLTPSAGWLLLPLVIVVELVLVNVLALVLAPLYLVVRDTGYVVSAALTVGFFASPVLFTLDALPGWLQTVAKLNPMAAVIGFYRLAVLGEGWPPTTAVVALVLAIGGLALAGVVLLERLGDVLDEYW